MGLFHPKPAVLILTSFSHMAPHLSLASVSQIVFYCSRTHLHRGGKFLYHHHLIKVVKKIMDACILLVNKYLW